MTEARNSSPRPRSMRDVCCVFANDLNFRSYGSMRVNRAEDYPGLTPEALVEWNRSLGADRAAWVMAKLQSGHALFPSRVLPPMANLAPDFYRRWCELSRAAGMHVIAYTCGGDDEYAFQRHPEWFEESGRYFACLNAPFWDREFEAVREMLAIFPADSVFYDMVKFSGACTCRFCRAAYRRLYGVPMPKRRDTRKLRADKWNWPEERRDTLRFRLDSFRQWVDRATDAARSVVPGIEITINQQWDRREGVPDELLDRFDYYFCEFGPSEWVGEILRAQGGPDKPVLCGSFPFDPNLSAHLMGRRIVPYSADVLTDHRTGRLVPIDDPRVLRNRLGLNDLHQCAPYTLHASAVPHAAVLYSDAARTHFSLSGTSNEGTYSSLVAASLRDASRLNLTCCSVEIADRLTTEKLDSLEVIFAPDLCRLDPRLAGLLYDWVSRGGILYASGLFACLDEDGKSGPDFHDGGLLGVSLQDGPLETFAALTGYLDDGRIKQTSDIVAVNDSLLCVPTTAYPVGFGSVGTDTGVPLLWENRIGKGTALYLAGRPREGGYAQNGQLAGAAEALRECLRALLLRQVKRAPFLTTIEYPGEVWLNEQTDDCRLVMHVVAFDRPLAADTVSVRADLIAGDTAEIVYPAAGAALLRGERGEGYVRFTLPDLRGHAILTLRRA